MAEDKQNEEGKKSSNKKTSNEIEIRGNIASISNNDMGDGKTAYRISVATADSYHDGKEWKQRKPEFTNINITNQAQVAKISAAMALEGDNQLKVGSQFGVEGFIKRRSFEKDGETKYVTEVTPRTGESAITTSFDSYKNVNDGKLQGYVSGDPVFGETANGKEFVNFSVATDFGFKKKPKEGESASEAGYGKETTFTEIKSYSPKIVAAAKENAEKGEFGVGSLVNISGRLTNETFTRADGTKGYSSSVMMSSQNGLIKIIEPSTAKKEADKVNEAATKNPASTGRDQEVPF
jgi:single-stranded DNA-binding protein